MNRCKLALALLILFFIVSFLPNHLSAVAPNAEESQWISATVKQTGQTYTFYSSPQVVWNGEEYVEYIFEQIKQNEFWIQCPTSTFYIKTNNIEVWTVNKTEQIISKMNWEILFWNGSAWIKLKKSWSQFEIEQTSESVSISRYQNLTDGSWFNYTWQFTNHAKNTFSFKPAHTGNYSISWHTEVPKASNYTMLTNRLVFRNESSFLAYLDYNDAELHVSNVQVTSLGATGRKGSIVFDNKTFDAGELLEVDPTTSTFYSEAALDGYINAQGSSYPPNPYSVKTADTGFAVGQNYLYEVYYVFRGYISFDTSSIPDDMGIISAKVKLRLQFDLSDTNFFVQLYSGSYGGSLDTGDWNLVTTSEGDFSSTSTWSVDQWKEKAVSIGSVSKTGRSQYKLISSRDDDGNTPSGNEHVKIYSGDSDSDPQLEVTYGSPPTIGITSVTSTSGYWYSQYTTYSVTVPVTDQDGYENITEVRIRLGDSTHEYKWTGTSFTEIMDTGNYYTLQSGGTYSGSGNLRTVVFKLKADWTAGDGAKTVYAYAKDNEGVEDGWDDEGSLFTVESDLTSSSLAVNDYRVNPSQTLTMSGYWSYEGSSVPPPDGNYQVKIKLAGVQKGSTDTTLVNGQFIINDVTAIGSVGVYYYKVECDYMLSAGSFNEVVVDRLEVTISADNKHADVNELVTLTVSTRYWYDHTSPTGLQFVITRNGTNYATSTPFTDNRSSYGVWQYTTSSANETQYDLNTFSTNTETVEWGFTYHLYGVYDEEEGTLYSIGDSKRTANVTVYFPSNATDSFLLNGTSTKTYTEKPIYFQFNLSTTYRQYWLSEDEASVSLHVFDAEDMNVYTVNFLDLAGILDEEPYVSAKRNINGVWYVVDKRKVDIEHKVQFSLKLGEKYTILISDGATWTYGDLLFTGTTSITLTLRGIDFPKTVLLTYKYMRIYGLRAFLSPTGKITITYQDLLNMTNNVKIWINYRNGTNVYMYTETTDSFSHEWTNASNDTDYAVVCRITHERYGVYTWRQYFPRTYNTPNPWDSLAFLGALPFNVNLLVGALLILFVGGSFSQVNPEIGAFLATVTAAILTYIGWISIAPGLLITAFTLSIMLGLVMKKRGLR